MPRRFQKNLLDYEPVKTVSDQTGKKRIKYAYRGETYTFDMPHNDYCRLKLILSLAGAVQLVLYFFITLRHIPSNSSFVMLPAACSLLAAGYMDMGILTLLTSKMEMPAWEHFSLNTRLKRGSILSSCLFCITFLFNLVFTLLYSREYIWSEFFNCICYLILALISVAVHTRWKKVSFHIKEGEKEHQKKKELMDDIEHAFGNTSDFH